MVKIISSIPTLSKKAINVIVQNPVAAGSIGGVVVIFGAAILIKKKFFKSNVTNETIAPTNTAISAISTRIAPKSLPGGPFNL